MLYQTILESILELTIALFNICHIKLILNQIPKVDIHGCIIEDWFLNKHQTHYHIV